MEAIFFLCRLLSILVVIYSLICVIRVAATWFPGMGNNLGIIEKITDPWLNLFQGKKWLRFSGIDFSPILSLGLLWVIFSTLQLIGTYHVISLSLFLRAILFFIIKSFISFIFGFFAIVGGVRLIILFVKPQLNHPLLRGLDRIIAPVMTFICDRLFPKRIVDIRTRLIILTVGALCAWALTLAFFALLDYIVAFIPF
jgi:YggT family protein